VRALYGQGDLQPEQQARDPSVGTTKRRAIPGRRRKKQPWDTNYFSWLTRSTQARGIAEAPEQPYTVSIA
jgi:hypothetical protein